MSNRRSPVLAATPLPHRFDLSRRALLQVGYSGLLGLGLPTLMRGRAVAAGKAAPASRTSPRSVILVFLTGAPSHLDMFDLKTSHGHGLNDLLRRGGGLKMLF